MGCEMLDLGPSDTSVSFCEGSEKVQFVTAACISVGFDEAAGSKLRIAPT